MSLPCNSFSCYQLWYLCHPSFRVALSASVICDSLKYVTTFDVIVDGTNPAQWIHFQHIVSSTYWHNEWLTIIVLATAVSLEKIFLKTRSYITSNLYQSVMQGTFTSYWFNRSLDYWKKSISKSILVTNELLAWLRFGLTVCYQPIWPDLKVLVNSSQPSEAIWRQRTGSTLTRVMACCLVRQAITWTNVDLSSVSPSNIHLRTISQEFFHHLIMI